MSLRDIGGGIGTQGHIGDKGAWERVYDTQQDTQWHGCAEDIVYMRGKGDRCGIGVVGCIGDIEA